MRLYMGLAAMAIALAGCAGKGLLEPDAQGTSEAFVVNADPMAALRRVSEYVRICHEERVYPYGASYEAKRQLGERGLPHQVMVSKTKEPAKILEQIQVQEGERANQAQVKIIVLGEGIWDAAEIAAARESIETSTPVCRKLEN